MLRNLPRHSPADDGKPPLTATPIVEVIGAEVVAEAVAGQDRIQDRQDLHQDQDLVQEAHTGVEIEVVMGVWI